MYRQSEKGKKMRNRNSYIGEVMFLLTMIYETNTRNDLFKILYGIQSKVIYTSEIMKLEKIKKDLEKEQTRMWDE